MTDTKSRRRVPFRCRFWPYVLLGLGACATSQPAPRRTEPVPAEPRPIPAEPGARPAPVPPPEVPPAPVEPAPPVVPGGPRLAWVNPARCLQPCTYDPSPGLVRVNERGVRDRRGRHRVSAELAPELRELVAAARAEGHILRIDSAYRSYEAQAQLFATILERGRAARPGHSEHQLGTAVDLRLPSTAAIGWLAENAPLFGFVVSYPPGKQKVTGYRPEPWHVRYVGRALAEQVAAAGGSLEEFFRARPELGESGSCASCPEPASQAGCAGATRTGVCDGTVLTWCYEGALAAVDCAASKQICGPSPASGEPDCLDGPALGANP
jgi:zinc D-Ala-D-Ala carboxypeptidase